MSYLLITAALAQDTLYAPTPPPDSAFVRTINGTALAVEVSTGDVVVEPNAASGYVVVPQGSVTVSAGEASHDLQVEAGRFYSVAFWTGEPTVLIDERSTNMARAGLTLYNLTGSAGLTLGLADGSAAVVEGVASGASGTRIVSAVTADLAVFDGDTAVARFEQKQLERGGGYSVLVSGEPGQLRASWVENSTN